jgi:hypothetical protein
MDPVIQEELVPFEEITLVPELASPQRDGHERVGQRAAHRIITFCPAAKVRQSGFTQEVKYGVRFIAINNLVMSMIRELRGIMTHHDTSITKTIT